MRKATCIFDRAVGVNRSVRFARSYRPAYLLSLLLPLIPHSAFAQSKAEWDQYKIKCNIPASTSYNDWVAQGSHCNTSNAAATPSVPALNPQQQLAMQGAALAGNMIGQALGQLLFGSPAPPPVSSQPDPEQQQRELAAQQLNNSGLYLLKQKNYAGAINEFQKALAIIPNDSITLHNLALAKQKLKDTAVAGQTSAALGQLLGNAPANSGNFNFDQLTNTSVANPNASALSLVNLDYDAKVVDLGGTTKTSVDPEALKNQIVGVLGNAPPVAAAPEAQTGAPQAQDIEKLFQAISGPAPEIKSPKMDAERTTKEIDQALGQDRSAGTHQPQSQGVGGNAADSADANAGGHQPSAHVLDGVANPDFDGRTTGNAALKKFELPSAQPGSAGVDLRDAGTTTVAPARVRGPSLSNGGSEPATPVAFAKSPLGSGGISASGFPIFDCSGDAATINRLVAGLPAQQEAIRRSQAAFDAAREDAQHDSAEAREKWTEGTIKMLASTASSIASSSQKLLAAEEGKKAAGIPANVAARYKFLEKIKKIHELSDKLEGVGKSYLAGNSFENTLLVQKTARDLTDLIGEAGILLVDSGIAEEAGGKFALALWGPIGELGFQGITTGLDLLTSTSAGVISASQADQAKLNLEMMRSDYQRIQDRIYELQQELAQGCSRKTN